MGTNAMEDYTYRYLPRLQILPFLKSAASLVGLLIDTGILGIGVRTLK